MKKFVCVTASKADCETSRPDMKAKLKPFSGDDKAEKPPMNPPIHKPDPFAIKVREKKDPVKIASPAKSSIRGDVKDTAPVTNADIMAFLLKNFGK